MDSPQITGADAKVRNFLDAWHSPQPYITAHTSGSTGTPKEIHLLKADMEVSARATCERFGITGSSHLLMPLSADYIAGKMMIVRALVSGARLTVLPPSRRLSELKAVNSEVDLLPIVPAQIDGLLKYGHPATIRNVIIGGAPLTDEQERKVADSCFRAYATYGMTETCSHVALRRIGLESAFEAMPGIHFSTDADSCLIINAPAYNQRTYLTTDIVDLIDEHHFRWLGRRDNVINSGGIKIIPEEAEKRLRPFFPYIDFYVTGRPSTDWGQEMVMVVAHHGHALDLTDFLRHASASLDHHLLPKAIIQVAEHEYTSTGKLRRILPKSE